MLESYVAYFEQELQYWQQSSCKGLHCEQLKVCTTCCVVEVMAILVMQLRLPIGDT